MIFFFQNKKRKVTKLNSKRCKEFHRIVTYIDKRYFKLNLKDHENLIIKSEIIERNTILIVFNKFSVWLTSRIFHIFLETSTIK